MEPHTALVEIQGDEVTVWASTQAPFRARDEVAQALGVPVEKVRVIPPFVGGGFGGKTRHIQVVQAAQLAKMVGKPVQVAWSRADEFFWDTYRPAALVKIKSGLSPAGKIVFWDYEVYWAGERSSQQFYDIPHHRTVVRGEWGGGGPQTHPFEVGAWRGPASNTNTFARESQIDILAAGAGMDPVEFRLHNLANPRMARVIKAAAEIFGWKPGKGASGRGLGFACADYLGTYVAVAAQLEVNRKSGAIRVLRVVCAQDMGPIVNPEGAKVQIEGCVMMGLGYCLTEEIRFRGGEVLDRNFSSYQIPRFSWLPEITPVLVESPELPFAGCGEPAITLMGAVLANAVFDATGARMLELPMTPDRLKAALASTASS